MPVHLSVYIPCSRALSSLWKCSSAISQAFAVTKGKVLLSKLWTCYMWVKTSGKWLRVNKMPFTVHLWLCFSAICPFDCRFTYITKVLLVFYKCILLGFEVFESVIAEK